MASEPGALPSTTPFDLPRPPEATTTGASAQPLAGAPRALTKAPLEPRALFGPVLPPFPVPVVFTGPDSAAADLPRPPEVTVETDHAEIEIEPAAQAASSVEDIAGEVAKLQHAIACLKACEAVHDGKALIDYLQAKIGHLTRQLRLAPVTAGDFHDLDGRSAVMDSEGTQSPRSLRLDSSRMRGARLRANRRR